MLIRSYPSNRGILELFTGTDPAQNTQVSEAVPANEIWHILHMEIELLTEATSATRQVYLEIKDSSKNILVIPASTTQIENIARQYYFFNGAPIDNNVDTIIQTPTPDLWLPAGYQIETAVDNMQAEDNFRYVFFMIEKFIGT